MEKGKKKNLTIDGLGLMVGRGFQSVDERFDKVEKGLGDFKHEVSQRFYELNQRFDKLERIILEDYGNRIEILESQVKNLQSDFRKLVGSKNKF